MNSKRATHSGSPRSRTPDTGPWMKTPLTTWGAIRDALPAPWPPEAVDLDLDWMAARQRYLGIAPEPAQALAARWGCGRHTAWRRLKAITAPATACNSVQLAAPSEVLSVDVLDGAFTMPATACTMPATTASTMPTDAVLSAPVEVEVEVESNQRESTPEPAHAAQAEPAPSSRDTKLIELWEAMEDVRVKHAPGNRLAAKPRLSALRTALKAVKDVAAEAKLKPEALLLTGWRYVWEGADPWLRETVGWPACARVFLRGQQAVTWTEAAMVWQAKQAAKAPPAPDAPATPARDAADDAWDVWVSGIEEARAWVAARRGSREAAAFTAAMERAVHPNPIAEFYGALAGKRDRAMAREVFVREFRSRTAPALRLVSK